MWFLPSLNLKSAEKVLAVKGRSQGSRSSGALDWRGWQREGQRKEGWRTVKEGHSGWPTRREVAGHLGRIRSRNSCRAW